MAPAWDGTISFTPTMGASHGTTFTFEISFADIPRDQPVDISVRHVPGSGIGLSGSPFSVAAVDVIDIGGAHATQTVGMVIYFPTPTLYFAFEALVGMLGQLIYMDSGDAGLVPATPHGYTAILTKLARRTRNLTTYAGGSPPAHFSETHADAEWLITGTF